MLKPEDITIVVDTREQRPLVFTEFKAVKGTLSTGDYSAIGYEDQICVERKSLDDLCGSLGLGRERFDREIERMLLIRHKAIMIEASMEDVYQQRYISKISPKSIIGSLMRYASNGISPIFCGNRANMVDAMQRFIFLSCKTVHASREPCWNQFEVVTKGE